MARSATSPSPAHRRSYGDNFLYVDRLEHGDTIAVETSVAWFVFEVTDHERVTPDQWQVTAPVPGDEHAEPHERLITLITCHSTTRGAWGNDHRWVVHGTLKGWVEHDAGAPDDVVRG
ncbi:sortase [Cellulosimicrobium funkei]|uniref:sortase domain-containing protein n=1 Tax=Cellulosimicrobium funkei TaxID=264251 RepID=UPI003756E03D